MNNNTYILLLKEKQYFLTLEMCCASIWSPAFTCLTENPKNEAYLKDLIFLKNTQWNELQHKSFYCFLCLQNLEPFQNHLFNIYVFLLIFWPP